MKYSKKDVAQEMDFLLENLKPGVEVYTTVKSVAKSGMSRTMKLYIVRDGRVCGITYSAAVVLGEALCKDGTLRVHGCGMDMGFETVYRLSRKLFPNGTSAESDGGYTLKQRWL
jgi:hypothetical protein